MNRAEKKCYALIQQIVTLRDRVCLRCADTPISAHHVFGRRNHGSAFEPDSCLSLCPHCHDWWARTCPNEVHDLLREKIGDERYEHLAVLSAQVMRFRERDFMDIAIELGKKLLSMKSLKNV